jgi:hypothetical protein
VLVLTLYSERQRCAALLFCRDCNEATGDCLSIEHELEWPANTWRYWSDLEGLLVPYWVQLHNWKATASASASPKLVAASTLQTQGDCGLLWGKRVGNHEAEENHAMCKMNIDPSVSSESFLAVLPSCLATTHTLLPFAVVLLWCTVI